MSRARYAPASSLGGLEPDEAFLRTVVRLGLSLQHTALLARQPCARQFFGNCPIQVGSHFCRAHLYKDRTGAAIHTVRLRFGRSFLGVRFSGIRQGRCQKNIVRLATRRIGVSPSGQIPRFRLQPFTNDAGALLAIGRPALRQAIVRDVIALDAERLLDDLGGAIAVIAFDGLFEQIGHGGTPY